MENLVELKQVSKVYGRGDAQVTALQGVDLALHGGDFVALMGPSGSGKSTFLHLVGCLDSPTSGEIFIDGLEVSALSPSSLWQVRNKKIGFVFQSHHLIPTLTAMENVMLPLKYGGTTKQEAAEKAFESLKELGLAKRVKHFPSQLSGGEQARVALARALINDPVIVLADEPTGELDTKTGAQVMAMLKDHSTEDKVFMIVTHDPTVADYCHSVYEMQDGTIMNH